MIKTENSSNRIFIIVIALLLIANIATLSMLLFAKKTDPDERKNLMRGYLKNEINFDKKQLEDFDTIKSNHRVQVKYLFENMRAAKQENLKKLVLTNFNDSSLNTAAAAAAAQQQNLEMNMLRQLRDVRNLCTPTQRAQFDTGFYKVINRPMTDLKKREN